MRRGGVSNSGEYEYDSMRERTERSDELLEEVLEEAALAGASGDAFQRVL